MSLAKFTCIYVETKGAIQIARFDAVVDYVKWADSAHDYGVRWSNLIESNSGKVVLSYIQTEDGHLKLNNDNINY